VFQKHKSTENIVVAEPESSYTWHCLRWKPSCRVLSLVIEKCVGGRNGCIRDVM